MSDRLGAKPCWNVEVSSGQTQHFPNASAEVGDSGALLIRKPVGDKDNFLLTLVIGSGTWTFVRPCEGKGDGHDF